MNYDAETEALWDAIRVYVVGCGGVPTDGHAFRTAAITSVDTILQRARDAGHTAGVARERVAAAISLADEVAAEAQMHWHCVWCEEGWRPEEPHDDDGGGEADPDPWPHHDDCLVGIYAALTPPETAEKPKPVYSERYQNIEDLRHAAAYPDDTPEEP